jgi:hypothetical protein
MTTYQVIGRSIARHEGADKVTGTARYTADVSLPFPNVRRGSWRSFLIPEPSSRRR